MHTLVVDRLVGQVLGTYRVERLMGQGRLNAVYLARHLENESTVAVTLYILPEKFSPEARQRFMYRFRKEGAALTSLRHEHILPVHEFGEYQGYPYLITPYMMNGSLADLLKREGRLEHPRVGEILEEIVAGLEYAHSKGIVHGTLKPANVVLNAQQKMQVAGFGLMHILQKRGIEASEQPYAHLLSIVDTFLAAPEYLAPEIVQGQAIDMRSDVYALGCILFELLSGKVPFTGGTPIEIARKHVEQAIPSLRAQHSDIPIAISSVVNQALDHDPARRFQRASELAEAFAQASRGATGSHQVSRKQGAIDQVATRADHPPITTSRMRSAGSWQFSPPIVTGKVAAVPNEEQNTTVRPQPAKPVHGNTDAWQFLPPIVTGNLPAVETPRQTDGSVERVSIAKSSAMAANESAFEAPTFVPPPAPAAEPRNIHPPLSEVASRGQNDASPWWTQPQEPVRSRPEAPVWENGQPDYAYAQPYPQPTPTRRSRTTDRRRRGGRSVPRTGRRKVVALLAAGGVALIGGGALVAANKNITHMASTSLHLGNAQNSNAQHTTTSGSNQASTTGQNANTQQKQPMQNKPANHTGQVISSTNQVKNSAVPFTNPGDQKASLLIRLPSGNFTAFERACTHEGVTINFDPTTQTLVCPAHGAIFNSATGAVIQGPAQRPITKVAVRVNADGTITV